jgi:hypothetical protein
MFTINRPFTYFNSFQSNFTIFLVYIGIPFFLLYINPQSIYSILTVSISQLILTFIDFTKYFSKPQFRNNPFIMGGWVYSIYLGLAPLLLYFNIELVVVDWNQWLSQEGFDNKSILTSQLLLNIFGMFLIVIGKKLNIFFDSFYKKLFKDLLKKESFFINLCLLLSGFQVYFILTGKISLGGISKSAIEGGIDPTLSILFPCFYVIPFLSGIYIKFKSKKKLLWLLILVLQIPWLFLLNKRSMFLGIYLFSITFYCFEHLKITRKSILFFFIYVALFAFSASIFQRLRTIGLNNIINEQEYFKLDYILENPELLDNALMSDDNQHYGVTRPFSTHTPISRFCYLIENQDIFLLEGEGIINTIKNATPSNFFFNKESIFVNEELYSHRYGSQFDYDDAGDSIVLQGLIDYGYYGVIVYSILFFILCYVCFLILVTHTSSIVSVLYLTQMVNLLLNSYEDTYGDVFGFIRILVVVSVIDILILMNKQLFSAAIKQIRS